MKTTIEIPDPLFRELKRFAAAHDLTLREAVERGLRKLMESPSGTKPFRLKKRAFHGEGMVDSYSWPEVRSIIYEGRGGDRG